VKLQIVAEFTINYLPEIMKIAKIIVLLNATFAEDPLRRQTRDLIGYNRQQNTVHRHMDAINSDHTTSDAKQQILHFMSINGSVEARKWLARRHSRLQRFKKFHN